MLNLELPIDYNSGYSAFSISMTVTGELDHHQSVRTLSEEKSLRSCWPSHLEDGSAVLSVHI